MEGADLYLVGGITEFNPNIRSSGVNAFANTSDDTGGAIALAAADTIIMLEHSVYSVISPEGCASILWRSADEAKTAAETLRLTAQDLKELKVIDEIVTEPVGGAHRGRSRAESGASPGLRDPQDLPLVHSGRRPGLSSLPAGGDADHRRSRSGARGGDARN